MTKKIKEVSFGRFKYVEIKPLRAGSQFRAEDEFVFEADYGDSNPSRISLPHNMGTVVSKLNQEKKYELFLREIIEEEDIKE